jgi:hypothetical protein
MRDDRLAAINSERASNVGNDATVSIGNWVGGRAMTAVKLADCVGAKKRRRMSTRYFQGGKYRD